MRAIADGLLDYSTGQVLNVDGGFQLAEFVGGRGTRQIDNTISELRKDLVPDVNLHHTLPVLATADVQELLHDQAVENIRLEFKREMPGKDETLKKLSSFANTFGGYLVVGAEAGNDGRITGLPGVEVQHGYKQTIIQWCTAGATPPLTAEVSDPIPVPAGNGRVCYVIKVPESELVPHFLNGRKGLYVRTDEFSSRFEPRLATEHEIRYLLDRSRLIREHRTALLQRAHERFQTFSRQQTGEELQGAGRCPCFSRSPLFRGTRPARLWIMPDYCHYYDERVCHGAASGFLGI